MIMKNTVLGSYIEEVWIVMVPSYVFNVTQLPISVPLHPSAHVCCDNGSVIATAQQDCRFLGCHAIEQTLSV
jgi:hypothetical protein